MIYSFPKQEKLCGSLRIKNLYANGRHFTCYPLRVTYRFSSPAASPVQVLVWAPKSLFKRAFLRNRLRRQMREAYRLHSLPLKQTLTDRQLQLAFNYIAKEPLPYARIEKAMQEALSKLCLTEIKEDNHKPPQTTSNHHQNPST